MSSRIKIKVIKKDELRIIAAPAIVETISEQENASQMASTVSEWIDEFQTRRREERATAVEQFCS